MTRESNTENLSDIRAVIIDFGFTLSSDYYFRELGSRYTERITELLFSRDSAISRRWMGGLVTSKDVAECLSDHLDASAEDIYSALARGRANNGGPPSGGGALAPARPNAHAGSHC